MFIIAGGVILGGLGLLLVLAFLPWIIDGIRFACYLPFALLIAILELLSEEKPSRFRLCLRWALSSALFGTAALLWGLITNHHL